MTEMRVRPNSRRVLQRRRRGIPAWLVALTAFIFITAAVAVASTSIALVVGLLLLALGAAYELRRSRAPAHGGSDRFGPGSRPR